MLKAYEVYAVLLVYARSEEDALETVVAAVDKGGHLDDGTIVDEVLAVSNTPIPFPS